MEFRKILNDEQIQRIHESTLEVLKTRGLKFTYAPARDILKKHGAKVEGEQVFFTPEMVMEKLKTVPNRFTLHARNPEKNVTVTTEDIVFCPGYGAAFVTDIDRGRREATLADYQNFAKLSQTSPYQDIVGGMLAEPNDIPPDIRHKYMMAACVENSDKVFMGSVMGDVGAMDSIRLAAMIHGCSEQQIKEKPAIVGINCSLTPLCYDDRMLSSLMTYAEYKQPQLVSSLAIAGATAPVTLAGLMVVQNAEVIAGIVLTQCVCAGTPVVFASGSSIADMRYGSLTIGAVEGALCSAMTSQMAKFYNMPSRGGGCLSDAHIADAQAGYESMLHLAMAENTGNNFILHSAGIVESYNCMSYEKFVIDDEICGIVKRLRKGVVVDDETLAVNLIGEVGSGGQYLDSEHTFEHFRTESFEPGLGVRCSYGKWQAEGGRQLIETANERFKKALEDFKPPELPHGLKKDLDSFIKA